MFVSYDYWGIVYCAKNYDIDSNFLKLCKIKQATVSLETRCIFVRFSFRVDVWSSYYARP